MRTTLESKFRFTTMPTPSVDYADGKPYQYIGTTTTTGPIYKHDCFYECKSQGTDPETYAWEMKNNGSTPVMQGATIYMDGESGIVPTPHIEERNSVLYGDGTWRNIYSASQGSTVIVKIDNSAVSCKGRTCTLTDGRTTLTATIDTDTGEAIFSNVQLFGGVTVTATDTDDNEAYGIGNVTYFGQYIIMLSMNVAVINLTTTDSDLFGQNLEVYKNGEQIGGSSFNILGQARIVVNEIAEYIIKTKIGNRFAKRTVNVNALGQTYTDTIELTTLFAVHYSERNSDPNSCTYPAGYSNSNFTDPFYVNLSNGTPHWGDWASDQAKFLIPKSCMLKSDGTVDYYLNEDNNKKKANGASSANGTLSYDGNAMMEWAQEGKRIYWILIPDADEQGWTFVVGDGDYDGLLKPWNHIAYDGSINHHFYLPKYAGGYVYNNQLRSMSGYQPTNNVIVPSWITYARANNKTSAVIWDVTPFVDWLFLSLMCVLFSKSLNSQAKFGRGWVDGATITSGNGAKTSGGMDTRGLFYGNSNTTSSTLGVKVFGTEHLYGNINKVMLGLINDHGTVKAKMCYGRADGSTVDDYNLTGTGYIEQGTISGTANTPVKNMNITSLALTPKVADGSTSTYYCDDTGFRTDDIFASLYGGNSWQGNGAGNFRIGLGQYVNIGNYGVGAGLSCKPLGDIR